MKPFEIFRSGRHTSMQGDALTFAEGDLVAIVGGYDTALHHAPIVVGHPKTDAPAYGWIDGLNLVGDRIVAKPARVDAAFADLVKAGSYGKVSAAFYPPAAANNPTPGAYYLRHVGFLGAAAPAVKGLKPVDFADDDGLVFAEIEFAEWRDSWVFDTTARLFRGLRDWLIDEKGLDAANMVVPEWEITQLTSAAAEIRAEANTDRQMFAEPPKGPDMTTEKKPAATPAELEQRERDIAAREASFADRERQARATADAAFVDGVVKAGRLPKGLQASAVALFAELDEDEITFAEGEEQKKTTPRAAFRDLLSKLPVPVVTEELATGADAVDFADPQQVAAAITTEIKAAADKGEKLSPADAAARLKLGAK